jgi:hypothetical protein
MRQMSGVLTGLERSLIAERTCVGVKSAQRRGVTFGRKEKLSAERIEPDQKAIYGGESHQYVTGRIALQPLSAPEPYWAYGRTTSGALRNSNFFAISSITFTWQVFRPGFSTLSVTWTCPGSVPWRVVESALSSTDADSKAFRPW